ncbi:hypothetical protein [Pseudochryseolinea flava]|nr:hypothetical protein [Pseudochryseolinea flava]
MITDPLRTTSIRPPFSTILIAGLLAGTLDGIGAMILAYFRNGVKPEVVFKYIASGYFGPEAFKGGTAMVMYGILFHYIIATGWALLLYVVYPYVIQSLQNKIIIGIIYGIVIWFGMNLIVVPASNVPAAKEFNLIQAVINAAILVVAVGLPITYVTAWRRSPK